MLYLKLKKGDAVDIKCQDEFSRLKVLDLYQGHWIKLIYSSDQSNFIMTVPMKTKFSSEVVDGSPLHFYVLKSSPSTVMLGVNSFNPNIKINRRKYNGC